MQSSIAIWQTFLEAFSILNQRMTVFIKTLCIPLLFFVFLLVSQKMIPGLLKGSGLITIGTFLLLIKLAGILFLVVFAWVINACVRITIAGSAGKFVLTSAELWTILWMVVFNFVITFSLLPLFFLGIGVLFSGGQGFSAGLTLAVACYVAIIIYLTLRCIFVFPAIAMNEKPSVITSWKLTSGNSLRVMVLCGLPFCFVIFLFWIMIFHGAYFNMGDLKSFLFLIAGVLAVVCSVLFEIVIIAVVYKRLRNH